MSKGFTWKSWGITIGLILVAGVVCLAAGEANAASMLFVLAALEGAIWAVVMAIANFRRRGSAV